MSVERFKGKYVIAESATNYIDVDSILKGYRDLKEAASRMKKTGKDISSTSNVFDRNNLFVTGETFDEYVKNCGDGISVSSESLSDYADRVLFEMNQALDKKQLELNHEARIRDAEIEKERASSEVK